MTAPDNETTDRVERAPRHRWGERFTRLDDTPSNCPQSERVCARCGLTRITVHPPSGLPWREWKPKGGTQMQFEMTPPCVEQSGDGT